MTALILRFDNPVHLTQTHYAFLVRQPCMTGYVFHVKFAMTALIWHSYVSFEIYREKSYFSCYDSSIQFVAKPMSFLYVNEAQLTYISLPNPCCFVAQALQLLWTSCIHGYDIPIFCVTKSLVFAVCSTRHVTSWNFLYQRWDVTNAKTQLPLI